MPSKRYKHIRKLLETKKAKIVCYKPFQVQLLYDSSTYVDILTFGPDAGRTNIGCVMIDSKGNALFRVKVETRNKEIVTLLRERRAHRQASRQGERKVRQRLAVKHTTIHMPNIFTRLLPNCEKPITCKYIKNTEAKYSNRKLELVKSKRSYRNPASILPGAEFIYNKERYILTGTLTNGKYYRAYGQGNKNFKASDCKIVKHNCGLVFI